MTDGVLREISWMLNVVSGDKTVAELAGMRYAIDAGDAERIVEGTLKIVERGGKTGFSIVVRTWGDAVKTIDDLIKPQITKLKKVYPDAKMGYRGSLATGTKYSTGGPFDPTDWDVDAFIVSDELAKKFKRPGFRDGREILEILDISEELEGVFKKIGGYRTEYKKPFTFRIWTEAEFNKIVKPNGYKLFE